MGVSAFDSERAWTADRIVEQFERENFSDRQVTEPCPLAQVAPVEEDAAAIGKANEAVSLPVHQRHDAARARRALPFDGPHGLGLMGRRRRSGGASGVLRHIYQRGSDRRRFE